MCTLLQSATSVQLTAHVMEMETWTFVECNSHYPYYWNRVSSDCDCRRESAFVRIFRAKWFCFERFVFQRFVSLSPKVLCSAWCYCLPVTWLLHTNSICLLAYDVATYSDRVKNTKMLVGKPKDVRVWGSGGVQPHSVLTSALVKGELHEWRDGYYQVIWKQCATKGLWHKLR
jgi:hypothetical protein